MTIIIRVIREGIIVMTCNDDGSNYNKKKINSGNYKSI